MTKKRKIWREKLHNDQELPKVVNISDTMSKRWGTGTCIIPAPREVDAIMHLIPRGKLVTINQIREVLATSY
ncbi:MAG: hypothetical protein WCP87_01870 [Atribacterota bacterium]